MNARARAAALLLAALALAALAPRARAINIEFGHLTDATCDWRTVTFDGTIANPLVFAKPAVKDDNSDDPAVPMIRNVASSSFQIRLVEPLRDISDLTLPNELDQLCGPTPVSYVVVAAGDHASEGTLGDNDLRVLAGSVPVTDLRNCGGTETVSFSQFTELDGGGATVNVQPVLFTQVQTELADATVSLSTGGTTSAQVLTSTRQAFLSQTEVTFAMMRDEEVRGSCYAGTETVAYALFSPGVFRITTAGNVNAVVEVMSTPSIRDSPVPVTFEGLGDEAPGGSLQMVLASMQTTNGGDSSWMRRADASGLAVTVWVEEGQSSNEEQGHTTEEVGLVGLVCETSALALGGPSTTFDNAGVAAACPELYASYVPRVPQPYVEVTLRRTSGTSPELYAAYGTAGPSTVGAAASDTSKAATLEVALPNVGVDGIGLTMHTGGDASAYTIEIEEPTAATLAVGTGAQFSTANEWALLEFEVDARYTAMDVVVRPTGGEPLEVYAATELNGESTPFVDLPTTVPGTFSVSADTADGSGDYNLRVFNVVVGRKIKLGVRSPGASGVSVDVLVLPAPPSITSATSTAAPTGGLELLLVTGDNFGEGGAGATAVTVDGRACTSPSYTATSVSCTLPEGQGENVDVVVEHYGVASLPEAFSYDRAEVTSFQVVGGTSTTQPATTGGVLQLSGVNFGFAPTGADLDNNTVTVGGVPCDFVPGQWSHTQLQCTMAAGQGSELAVVVTVGGRPSPGLRKVTYLPPRVTSMEPLPAAAAAVADLTLRGTNFGRGDNADLDVRVGGVACVVGFHDHEELRCDLAPGGGTGLVVAFTVAGQEFQNEAGDVSYAAPRLDDVQPRNGSTAGESLTLTGEHFGESLAAGGTVSFGSSGGLCVPTEYDDGRIVCDTPAGQGVGLQVGVSFGGQSSGTLPFSFDAPSISDVRPATGLGAAGGDRLTLDGASFGEGGGILVTAGGEPCTVVNQTHAEVICEVAAGVGTLLEVTAQVALQDSVSAGVFSYAPPAISPGGVSAPSDSTEGGYLLTVTGTNFGVPGSGAVVRIGGELCPEGGAGFADSRLECAVPPGTGTGLAVTVEVGGQTSAAGGHVFSYGAPSVSELSPPESSTQGGATLVVKGGNFGPAGGATVSVDGKDCPVTSYGHEQLLCELPEGRGVAVTTRVTVLDGRTADDAGFSYAAPAASPIEAGDYPTGGGVGLALAGSSFDTSGTVWVSGPGGALPLRECEQTASFGAWSHSAVLCELPEGEGAGVEVLVQTVGGRNSSTRAFSYNTPQITAVELSGEAATSGAAGTVLTVRGASLGLEGTVRVGDEVCGGESLHTHGEVRCELPRGQGTRQVSITVGGLESNGVPLVYAGPRLDEVSPTSDAPAGGTNLTLTGDNFGYDGEISVTVGDNACAVLEQGHAEVVCELPAGQGSAGVRVTVEGRSSDVVPFQYTGPRLDSVTPPAGGLAVGGDRLTLEGANFGASGTVLVGGRDCPVQAGEYNDTHVVCLSPAGQGALLDVVLTVEGQASGAQSFSYAPPSLSLTGDGVLPATGGTAGELIAVRGVNFGTSGLVQVGGVTCAQEPGVTTYTDTEIGCTMPAGAGLDLAVVVTVGGQASAEDVRWAYTAPEVTGVNGQDGPTQGSVPALPYSITVLGTNFGTAGSVAVGGQPCSVQRPSDHTHGSIKCLLPPGQGRGVAVGVEVGGQTHELAGAYDYGAPQVDNVEPLAGPTDPEGGVTVLTVTGSNFGTAGGLTVGGRACNLSAGAPSAVYSHTRLECRLPAGEGAAEAVEVTVSAQSDTFGTLFAYAAPEVDSIAPSALPTAGPADVTLAGRNLGRHGEGDISVQIGGLACAVSARSYGELTCSLGPGTGADLALRVELDAQVLDTPAFVSRVAPSISAVSVSADLTDCESDGAGSIRNCPNSVDTFRTITLSGANFGRDGSGAAPVVTVNGNTSKCLNETRLADDTAVTCRLRGGIGFDQELRVEVDGLESPAVLFSYEVPLPEANTLQFQAGPAPTGGAASRTVTAASTHSLGSTFIFFTGTGLREDGELPVLKYGTPGRAFEDLEYTATVLGSSTDTQVTFSMADGVGGPYAFVLDDTDQLSRESDDRLSYPKPVVVSDTLRFDVGGAGAATAQGSQNQQDLFFNARHVGTDMSLVRVYYGGGPDGTAAFDQVCAVSSLTAVDADTTAIGCRTAEGEGGGWRFLVEVGNNDLRSDQGSDRYSYPTKPSIDSVEGCARDNSTAGTAEGCLTEGGNSITIRGNNFTTVPGQLTVKIGNGDCAGVEVTGAGTVVECTTPPGTGERLSVLVVSGARLSSANEFLSYEAPELDGIEGCDGGGAAASSVAQCDREGGNLIRLRGSNFGASLATVLISGVECGGVAHAEGNEHAELTCVLPQGTRTERTVLVLQNRGELSSNSLRLSYRQCEAGSRDTSPPGGDTIACEPCAPGRFTPVEGLTECQACDDGFFANDTGATRCDDCLRGTFSVRQADGTGATACEDCGEGLFTSSDRQDSCQECPAGTFQTGFGRTACQACAAGTRNGLTGRTECEDCEAGSFSSEAGALDCDLCPAGRYTGSGGLSECAPCLAGEYHPGPGATECLLCPEGTAVRTQAQAICPPCGSGFFANDTGLADCLSCPAGAASVAAPGAALGPSRCEACPAGEYSAFEGQATCLLCAKGTSENATGSVACDRCAPGSAVDALGRTECDACAAGRFSGGEGAVLCLACDTGRFANDTGRTTCAPCEAGEFQGATGRSRCEDCAAGSAAGSLGQAACEPCVVGDHAPVDGLTSCTACDAGTVAAAGSAVECVECGNGTFAASAGQGVCDPCAPGRFGGAPRLTGCTLCPPGEVQPDSAQSACHECEAGTISAGSGGKSCVACPDGAHAPSAGLATCTPCGSGTFQDGTNTSECRECPLGSVAASSGQGECSPCGPGTFANDTGLSACLECPAGRFQRDPGTSFCEDCAEGTFSGAARQASCASCVEGRVAREAGLSVCEACDAGTFSGSRASRCGDCAAGEFAAADGSPSCEPCAAGRFNNDTGLSLCEACAAGRHQPSPGRQLCEPCAAGEVQPSEGQPACRSCDPGQFQPDEAREACRLCPAGRATAAVGTDAECGNCTAGFFAGGEGTVTCSPCAEGTFADTGGLSACLPCEAGRFQPSGARSSCEPCANGTANDFLGQTACPPCEPGTFANATALRTCSACPAGKQSGGGASECTDCEAGRFSDIAGFETCSACPDGWYQGETGQTLCLRCEPGTFAETQAQSACEECEEGRAAGGSGSQACAACDLGRFAEGRRATTCVACAAGRHQDAPGSGECKECAVGKFTGEEGQATCNPCRAGFYAPATNTTACTRCEPGRAQSEQGQTDCVACATGEATPSEGQVECKQCEPGRFANVTGMPDCLLCDVGRFSVKGPEPGFLGASTCEECAAGRATRSLGQSVCPLCDAGEFASGPGLASCERCPPGTHSDAPGALECKECQEGTFSAEEGAVFCDPCPEGTFEDDDRASACQPCGNGTYMPTQRATVCLLCDPGSFNNAERQEECTPCAVGRFGNDSGLADCTDCAAGSAQGLPGQAECPLCLPGEFQGASTQARCEQCPRGRYMNDSGATECVECEPGRFQSGFGEQTCELCEEGRVAPRFGQSRCDLCEGGEFQNTTGGTNCTLCPAGSVQPNEGASVCNDCPAGEFIADAGLRFCRVCEAGTFGPAEGLTVCEECAPGSAQDRARQTECVPCDGGSTAALEGQVTCDVCPVGRFQDEEGRTNCTACPAGSVQPVVGQTRCELCAAGRFIADAGLERCRECEAGAFSNETGRTFCEACAPGTFQELTLQTACRECPVGRATAAVRQSGCQECVAGEFQAETGELECERCPAGRFQPGTTSSACVECVSGRFTPVPGLTECELCPPGRVQPEGDRTGCVECEPGLFQPDSGQTACRGCAPGTYQGKTGQPECLDCASGRVQARFNATACDACAAGQHQPVQAQTSCIDCAAGQAQPEEGQDSCLLCAPGTVHRVPGKAGGDSSRYPDNAQCDICPPGRVQPEPGQVACTACTRGFQVADPADRVQCEACPPLTFSSSDGEDQCTRCEEDSVPNDERTECRCRVGTYGFTCDSSATGLQPERCNSSAVADKNRVCIACPDGALCEDEGVEFETLASESGFWCGTGNYPPEFYRCLIRSHCESGACSAGSTAAALEQSGSQCADHRTGPICAVCEPDYSATTVTAACEKCPSRTESLASTIGIGVVILLVVCFMYWVVLRADRDLMEDAKKRAEHKKENQWAWFEEDESIDDPRKRALFSNQYERGQGGPVAVPNFTYKMKIMLGFFQITTNLALALDVPWPSTYQEFVAVFSIVNFDIISWSNAGCLLEVDYETTLVVFTVTPIAVLILVSLVYLLPRYLRHQQDDYDLRRAARDRSTKQFWKMFLFTLFLIYPSVSATAVRVFVCREIEGTSYLLADMSIECGSPKWVRMAYIAAVATLVYALGIPAYFYWLLRSHRGTLHLPESRIQLGFLYEAYAPSLWFFELVDMGNKLFMVAVLGFLPQNAQLPVGMVWTIGYLAVLLLARPYLRLGDDRLHLFVQVEIFVLLLAAHTLLEAVELDDKTDIAMSAILIGLTMGLILVFLVQVAFVLRRMQKRRKDKKLAEAEAAKNAALENNEAVAEAVTGLRMPKDAMMTRNPLFDGSQSTLVFEENERVEAAPAVAKSGKGGGRSAVAAQGTEMASLAGDAQGEPASAAAFGYLRKIEFDDDDLDDDEEEDGPGQYGSAFPGGETASADDVVLRGGDDDDDDDGGGGNDSGNARALENVRDKYNSMAAASGHTAAGDDDDEDDDEDDDDDGSTPGSDGPRDTYDDGEGSDESEEDDDFGATSFAPRKSQSRRALI